MTPTLRTFLAGLAGAVVASAASAQDTSPQVRERYSLDGQHIIAETTIPLAGLDLSRAVDVRTLLDRIQEAADRVCASPGHELASVEIECRAQAVHDAVVRAGSPALSDLADRAARRP